MPVRRILSLWFPSLGAERWGRVLGLSADVPLAVVGQRRNAQVLVSISRGALAAGLSREQPLRDAQAMCPELLTRTEMPPAEAAFLAALRRWAGKFSPWVAEEPPESLVVDLTGCAHLFGGEPALLAQVEEDCGDLGLTVRAGIADTVGAAWALSRYAGERAAELRSGDAIDMEARATRARAQPRRRWDRVGAAAPSSAPSSAPSAGGSETRIAAPGRTRAALAPLPVAALRIDPAMVADLGRLGLRRVEDLAGQPRAALARRFGRPLVRRLDQAMGVEPEPVSPARTEDHFAVRLTLPDPIGLEDDVMAAIDRCLPRLGEALAARGRGARTIRLEAWRTDHTLQAAEVGLARPSADPDRIRPLLKLKLPGIDAGFGIDRVRLIATVTEPVHAVQHRGHAEAAEDGARRQTGGTAAFDDLIGRIGARVGLDAITRLHPASSHIPEKTATVLAAAWSEPATEWPRAPVARPVVLFRPEPVTSDDPPGRPAAFRWRRRRFAVVEATGPERIAPEWWLDEPDWRSGVRDYWRVTTDLGEKLWLFYAHGGTMSAGWFCHGRFA